MSCEETSAANKELGQLPPAMPKVVFDTGWGKRASWLDFDYRTFYELAHEEDMSDQAIDDLEIVFGYADPKPYPLYLGRFSWAKQRMHIMSYVLDLEGSVVRSGQVSTRPFNAAKNLDSCVRHEMGHWINGHSEDSTEGILRQRKRAMTGLGILSIVASTALVEASDRAWYATAILPMFFGSVAAWMRYDARKHGESYGDPLRTGMRNQLLHMKKKRPHRQLWCTKPNA